MAQRLKSANANLDQMASQGILKSKKHESKLTDQIDEEEDEILYSQIMPMLSGFARIIKYLINDKGNLNVLEITEGRFKNGMKSGYCRIISAITGNCEVGFF